MSFLTSSQQTLLVRGAQSRGRAGIWGEADGQALLSDGGVCFSVQGAARSWRSTLGSKQEASRGNWLLAKTVLKGREVGGRMALAMVTRQEMKRTRDIPRV